MSQYLINVIDFRDPDATVTIFQNPDVLEVPARVKGQTYPPSTTAETQSAPPKLRLLTDPSPTPNDASPLVQFGMEYSPVAITEVLAYTFNRKDTPPGGGAPTNVLTPRLFIEMVNTLTKAGTDVTGPPPYNPSDLNLAGWDMVVAPDDVTGRPDPVTGQIPPLRALDRPAYDPVLVPYMRYPINNGLVDDQGQPAWVQGIDKATPKPNYFVLANNPPQPLTSGFNPAKDETGTPTVNGIIPPPPGPPTTPPSNYLIPTSGGTFQTGKYYWLYLRRPANPFDPTSTMIVVDAFRFPFIQSDGTGVTGTPDRPGMGASVPIYSMSRYQPYRGGHAVPFATAAEPTATPPPPVSPMIAYGFSEQTSPAGNGGTKIFGLYNSNVPPDTQNPPPKTTVPIPNSFGRGRGEAWDYFPFQDRDFMNVAELLMVPGCPPGLFTKQFVENAPDTTVFRANPDPSPNDPSNANAPYPYLTPPPNQPTNPAANATTLNTDVVGRPLLVAPRTYPYLVDEFFYTAVEPAAPVTMSIIGGPTGAGWYKMFEFFDVPSPNAGTIGPVAQGQNFDWLRQDRKPGQLNLNLIIDEEVFLGLIDDYGRLNSFPAITPTTTLPQGLPQVVTGLDASGNPIVSSMSNRGYLDPANPQPFPLPFPANPMKAVFADFLKLRHGGSNGLFGYGFGGLPAERPFHSLSYPDIDYTLMRPATLPPANPTASSFDPGHKNPTFSAYGSGLPPAIPPRRLFEIPDNTQATGTTPGSNASESGDSRVNTPVVLANLSNPATDLSALPNAGNGTDVWLGGNPTAIPATPDRREHPYFRTEWMQKMMNLTTTRTHQYAVWITVGFFEVTREGNPQTTIPTPDTLGRELGKAAGRSVRYRSFFLVDRTRAIGFNPQDPGDFRDCVVYRSRIE